MVGKQGFFKYGSGNRNMFQSWFKTCFCVEKKEQEKDCGKRREEVSEEETRQEEENADEHEYSCVQGVLDFYHGWDQGLGRECLFLNIVSHP